MSNPELILSAKGTPFESEKGCRAAMMAKGMKEDQYSVVEVKGGWAALPPGAVVPLEMMQVEAAVPPEDSPDFPPEQREEKYLWVKFYPKTNPNDTDSVSLGVNGETLQIMREKPVILPERYLECADHAITEQYRQLPNEDRKVVAQIIAYPYQILGENFVVPGRESEGPIRACESEYLKMKRGM